MVYDLSKYLVIGISSRALFDLKKENEIFEKQGLEEYSLYQIEHEGDVLEPGVGFALVRGLLQLNNNIKDKRKSEVIIMSRNNADTGLRIFNSIKHYGIDISRAVFTSGRALAPYLKALSVDLFLSADEKDVQSSINAGIAAGLIYDTQSFSMEAIDEIRIAFDADAVLFSSEAESIYKEKGLEAFLQYEANNARKILPEGPFAKLLKTLAYIQQEFSPQPPIRTALVTARNSPAHERVIRTLRAWNVRIDEAFFLGGVSKGEVLKAFGAHIFFDDQEDNIQNALAHVPVAKVPNQTNDKNRRMLVI